MSEPALKLNPPATKPPAKSTSAKSTRLKPRKSKHGVHLYYSPTGTYDAWIVTYQLEGRRVRVKRSKYDEAYNLWEAKERDFDNGNTWRENITREEFAQARNDQALLREENAAFAAAHTTKSEALQFWLKHHPAHITPRSIPDLVAELVAAKAGAGLSDLHTQDLEVRLNRFARDFQCPITSLTYAAVDRWLRDFKKRDGSLIALRSRNNYRSAIFALVDFAKTIKALPRDWSELDPEQLTPAKTRGKKIEIWTPGEMTLLLQSADALHKSRNVKDLVPYLATGAFAGPRSAELQRIDWVHNVKFENAVVKLEKDITKTERSRVVPIRPNLNAWLAPYRHAHGFLCPYRSAPPLHAALRRIAKHAGLRWKKNALRDSSISYSVALGAAIETVADWHGNSVGEIHENYLQHPDRKDAEAWFNILPVAADQKLLHLFG